MQNAASSARSSGRTETYPQTSRTARTTVGSGLAYWGPDLWPWLVSNRCHGQPTDTPASQPAQFPRDGSTKPRAQSVACAIVQSRSARAPALGVSSIALRLQQHLNDLA